MNRRRLAAILDEMTHQGETRGIEKRKREEGGFYGGDEKIEPFSPFHTPLLHFRFAGSRFPSFFFSFSMGLVFFSS